MKFEYGTYDVRAERHTTFQTFKIEKINADISRTQPQYKTNTIFANAIQQQH